LLFAILTAQWFIKLVCDCFYQFIAPLPHELFMENERHFLQAVTESDLRMGRMVVLSSGTIDRYIASPLLINCSTILSDEHRFQKAFQFEVSEAGRSTFASDPRPILERSRSMSEKNKLYANKFLNAGKETTS